jgi:hypothetical protein
LIQTGKSDPTDEMRDRLQQLWEWYWARTGHEDAASEPDRSLFGYWFTSRVFDDQWSLDKLAEFLKDQATLVL